MIRSIEIKGLRGIKEGKLDDLTPLTILVGPNGSGKSTVLDSLLIAGSPIPANAIISLIGKPSRPKDSPRWWLWNGRPDASGTIVLRNADLDATYVQLTSTNYGAAGNVKVTFAVARGASHADFSDVKPEILTEVASLGTGTANATHTEHVFGLEGIPSIDLLTCVPSGQDQSLQDLFSIGVQEGYRDHINSIVREVLDGANHIEILTEMGVPVLHVVYPNRSVPLTQTGEGIEALLRLSLRLVSKRFGVMLLEEPKVHLHPAAIRQSAKAIMAAVRRDTQVVLTTHSLELIDALIAETHEDELHKLSLYRTQLKDGCLTTSRIPGDSAARLRSSIEEDLR